MFSGFGRTSDGEGFVKLDKLAKTFRRDLAANPIKAGVLGVLLLGGMYFWGPLAWKWVGKGRSIAAPNAAMASVPALELAGETSLAVPAASENVTFNEAPIAWQEIRKRREMDPLAQSADYHPQWNQIFQTAPVTPVAEQPAEVIPKTEEEIDPRDLGFVLQGVLVGPKSKKAIINGVVYCERDMIPVSQGADISASEDAQPVVEFRLIRVSRKVVELERGGKIWQLKLATTEPLKRNSEKAHPDTLSQNEQLDEKAILAAEK